MPEARKHAPSRDKDFEKATHSVGFFLKAPYCISHHKDLSENRGRLSQLITCDQPVNCLTSMLSGTPAYVSEAQSRTRCHLELWTSQL